MNLIGQFSDPTHCLLEAVRRLWRNRALSVLVVLSLALGIGANTAIFTIVDALFLEPLPIRAPSRAIAIYTTDSRLDSHLGFSYPNFLDVRKMAKSFEDIVATHYVKVDFADGDRVFEAHGEMVSDEYFRFVGVKPFIGKLPDCTAEGESTEGPPLVLSQTLWRKKFDGSKSILGRTVLLNQSPFTVTAVLPDGFAGLDRMGRSDFWVATRSYRAVAERPEWMSVRRGLMFAVVGRLKDGVTFDSAAAEIDTIGRELALKYPLENAGRGFGLMALDRFVLGDQMRESMIKAAAVLLGASGVVLLIAVANIGNVLMARALVRRREMAVRVAMGATRSTLIGQILVECGLLVVLGGGIGLLLGIAGRDLLWRFRPEWLTASIFSLPINMRILGFAALLSLFTGLLATLLPLSQALRGNLTGELKERPGTPIPLRRPRLRHALVVCQLALSLIALVGADLFLKSLRNFREADPGFDTRHIASFDLNPRRQGLSSEEMYDFYEQAQRTVQSVTGVESVALSSGSLLGGDRLRRTVCPGPGDHCQSGFTARYESVSSNYFETTDVLILRGRSFGGLPDGSRVPEAIVNQTLATRFWPNEDAIGRDLLVFGMRSPYKVIGIARDASYNGIGSQETATVYVPIDREVPPMATIYFRAADPGSVGPMVAAAWKSAHENLPDPEITPLQVALERSFWAPRMAAGLLAVFGLLALALASIGVYGVTAHLVSQRTSEIGVRMALGACPVDVMDLILRQGMTLILPGLAIGAVASFVLARFFMNLLFEVHENDLEPYYMATILLALVALAASYLPARRAIRMQPSLALREQ